MSNKKGGLSKLFYDNIMPKIYGIGASVVIMGALFKILHLPGANEMLMIGLTTEAIIFFFSAFEPKPEEPDWSKVYPELAEDYEVDMDEISNRKKRSRSNGSEDGSVSKKLDQMLESSNVGPELIDSLGQGMRNLSESVSQMSSISNAAVASDEYAKNLNKASQSLQEINKTYADTVNAMQEMAEATKDTKQYHEQVQLVTKNLSSLNAVYEMELQDANSHLKAMNKFYSNLSSAMENVTDASKDAEQFKQEFSALNNNLSQLNKVYGSMLTAMKG